MFVLRGLWSALVIVGNCLFQRRAAWRLTVWTQVAAVCDRLGGAFPKFAQFLSTRPDLVDEEAIPVLARLQDRAQPLPSRVAQSVVKANLRASLAADALSVHRDPIACATLCQVHLADVAATGETIVLKIKRPGIEHQLRTDVVLITAGAKVLSLLPWLRCIPIRDSVDQWCQMLLRQTDFKQEVDCIRRFGQMLAGTEGVRIPKVFEAFCSTDVIAMEYLDGFRKLEAWPAEAADRAVVRGLVALYTMLFEAGCFHCDLHPGNVLCNSAGEVAIIDLGMTAEFAAGVKVQFADFFASIALKNGIRAARITLALARNSNPYSLPPLTADLQDVLNRVSGTTVRQFDVGRFVMNLFQIQRRHRIFGSPDFTLAIISLLTYEGLLKRFSPDLQFQRVAMPFVVDALRDKLILRMISSRAASRDCSRSRPRIA